MNDVVLDSDLRNKLGDLSRITNLRDERGHLVAHIVPSTHQYWIPAVSEEELDKEIDETTEWYTSEEVFGMLKKLEEGH
jgi:hypothetical protein